MAFARTPWLLRIAVYLSPQRGVEGTEADPAEATTIAKSSKLDRQTMKFSLFCRDHQGEQFAPDCVHRHR